MAALELMKNHVTSRLWDYAAGQERLSVPLVFCLRDFSFWEGCRIPLVELRQFKILAMQLVGLTNHKNFETLPIASSNRGLPDGILSICCGDATAGCCEGR